MQKIHRNYPDRKWNYKAITTTFGNKTIIYYTLVNNGKKTRGVEIYSGKNYNVNSSANSYSRTYSIVSLPGKYKIIVKKLISKHHKTKWFNKGYINLN